MNFNNENEEEKKNPLLELQNNINQLEQLFSGGTVVKEDLVKKLDEMKEHIRYLLDNEGAGQVKNNYNSLVQERKGKQDQIEQLEQQNEEKDKKIKELIESKDIIQKEKEDIEKKKDEYEKNIKELQNKITTQGKIMNNISTKQQYLEEKAINFYDVVIEIDSINKLYRSGWRINYNENRKEIYDKIVKEETIKIGVLGLNNVGKSFILGLIAGLEIPTGFSVETKGISIKYTEGEKDSDKGICILDSAGFETPLLSGEIIKSDEDTKIKEGSNIKDEVDENLSYMEKLNEIAKDKGQTERFIEELIIALSDMLILVVGKLTRREQNLISRIKSIVREKENLQFDSIIIIHNLAHYNELIEVDNHINDILKKSATFDLQPKQVRGIKEYEDRIFFTEPDGTDHYIMARDKSNAGEYYNNLTIQLIKQKYNLSKSRRKIDIPQEIINLFSSLSKDITEEKVDIESLQISEDRKLITTINKNSSSDIPKCQKTFIDEMGNYNSISSKYIPKCSYYVYKEKGKNILLVRLEIAGKIDKLTANFYNYGRKKTILIKGIKAKDEFPEMAKKSFLEIKDNRNYDEFKLFLELDSDIDLYKEYPIEKTQIYTIDFNLNNRDPTKIDEKSDDDEDEEDEEDKEQKKNEAKDEIVNIASGVYALKFYITDTSMKKLSKKYKKQNSSYIKGKSEKEISSIKKVNFEQKDKEQFFSSNQKESNEKEKIIEKSNKKNKNQNKNPLKKDTIENEEKNENN